MAFFVVACNPDLVKACLKSDALEINMIGIENNSTILQSLGRQFNRLARTCVVHTDSIEFTFRFLLINVASYSSNSAKIWSKRNKNWVAKFVDCFCGAIITVYKAPSKNIFLFVCWLSYMTAHSTLNSTVYIWQFCLSFAVVVGILLSIVEFREIGAYSKWNGTHTHTNTRKFIVIYHKKKSFVRRK